MTFMGKGLQRARVMVGDRLEDHLVGSQGKGDEDFTSTHLVLQDSRKLLPIFQSIAHIGQENANDTDHRQVKFKTVALSSAPWPRVNSLQLRYFLRTHAWTYLLSGFGPFKAYRIPPKVCRWYQFFIDLPGQSQDLRRGPVQGQN